MIIRKLYKFENAHIVRNCTSRRCSRSLHGHSYKVELLFGASGLDRGEMVYDFGLTKGIMKALIDAFDHAITLWSGDDPRYLEDMKHWSERWVELPVNPSAEQFARLFFAMIDRVLALTVMKNGEQEVILDAVIVHETDTGYARAERKDLTSPQMPPVDLHGVIFSDRVREEWPDPELWQRLLAGNAIENPSVI